MGINFLLDDWLGTALGLEEMFFSGREPVPRAVICVLGVPYTGCLNNGLGQIAEACKG